MKSNRWNSLLAPIPLAVLPLLCFTGCTTAPVTGRTQLSLVPESTVVSLGFSEFEKMKTSLPIDHDPAHNALVQKVGRRIATVAQNDMPNAQWEFVVFQSKDANAFCLPGGKVGVYSGILPITRDEGGLATVLGHEIAHATAQHGRERMSQQLLAQEGQQALGVALDGKSPATQQLFNTAFGLGAQLGVLLPFSRTQESEADHIGLIYMARAGYDPQFAVDFWQRFASFNQQQGRATPRFLSDHPLDQDRIRQLQLELPEARASYQPAR